MKKFLVLLVIVAMSCLSSMAFAADISVNGSIDFLGRTYSNLGLNSDASYNRNYTQERVRLNIDAKAGDAVSGRIGIENDWDNWGRFESHQANAAVVTQGTKTSAGPFLRLREAWIGFKMPGTPLGVKGGHMLLQLGNGWFFRDMKYGSDAWVVYTDIDALHLGVVNIKVAEGNTEKSDDTDAYAFVGTYKLSDTMTAGVNFTNVVDRKGNFMNAAYGTPGNLSAFAVAAGAFTNAKLQNLEVHMAGNVGPAKLKAEVDMQSGDVTAGGAKHKFKGNQVVIEGALPMDALTINATLARGSGATVADELGDVKEYIALMDSDVHYTLIYEYLVRTAANQSYASKGTGFGNTTAINLGAAYNVSKNLMVSLDAWKLQATQKVNFGVAGVADSNDLGMEFDAKINWKLYENLSWNNTIGYFMPGDAYKISATKDADAATAVNSVLSFKF